MSDFSIKSQMIVPMGVCLRAAALFRCSVPNALGDKQQLRYFSSGRLSLFALLQSLTKLSDRREILLPAYHCVSIAEACQWCALTVRFYNVSSELRPDVEDIAKKISSHTLAAVFVHYFGYPNCIADVSRLCRTRGVVVIEDASHIDLSDSRASASIGSDGDWVLGSLRKFYPVYDGAFIYSVSGASNRGAVPRPRRSTRQELRSVKHVYDALRQSKQSASRSTRASPVGDKSTTVSTQSPQGPRVPYVDHRFTVSDHTGMTLCSQFLVRKLAGASDISRRQAVYSTLLQRSERLSRCRPLFPECPPNVFPYVFPLRLNFPDEDHSTLRRRGIEILRWENLHPSDCAVSKALQLDLIQVPCHPGLTTAQIDYLLGVLSDVLR